MDPATLSVGAAEAVLEVGAGVSSMEKAEGGGSDVAGAVSADDGSAEPDDPSSHEGVSPSIFVAVYEKACRFNYYCMGVGVMVSLSTRLVPKKWWPSIIPHRHF